MSMRSSAADAWSGAGSILEGDEEGEHLDEEEHIEIHEEEAVILVEEEEIVEEVEEPYCPPCPNFIRILDRDGDVMLLNNKCRKAIFLEYVKQKADIESDCNIDFSDLEGALVKVSNLQGNDYVTNLFKETCTYIICQITRDGKGNIQVEELLLNDWKIRYPKLQDKLLKPLTVTPEVSPQNQSQWRNAKPQLKSNK